MKKHRLSLGLLSALIGTLAAVDTASAVHLSNNGIGQALVYPYYTVNAQQQTLLSVVNTSSAAKAVKVRFREGYNGRPVMEFDLFLSPYDVWTATVFALGDAGLSSDGAAILTRDRSCVSPAFSEDQTTLSDGTPYVAFREFGYLVPNDGGPYTIDRTREGHFEIIAMADLSGPLASAVTHTASGVPANCTAIRNLVAGQAGINPPSSGLFGSAGIINVPNGTYFGYDADALERFTATALYSNTAQAGYPDLGAVNDGAGALASQATALVVTPDGATLSTYPGADPRSRRIDAVSAVFAAENIYNEYQTAASIAANTDWVFTFPTKAHYVDKQYVGTQAAATPPFTRIYDGSAALAGSCILSRLNIYNREEKTTVGEPGFPGFPSPNPPLLCRQTIVLSFLDSSIAPTASGALQSRLVRNIRPVVGPAGWLRVNLDNPAEPHALLAASNGNVFRGLPVTGFAAISITNNQATMINGVSTLSNYSSTTKHRPTGKCINGGGGCQ